MSTRLKVFLIITAIILMITASSVIISISSAQSQILKTLEDNMQAMVSVANEYVINQMNLLKEDAAAVAFALEGYPMHLVQQSLIEQAAAYENFTAIAIFNINGRVMASLSIDSDPPPESVLAEYIQQVFEWDRVISTTYIDSTGQLVFYVFVPMGDDIVGLTISGYFFRELMNQFTSMSDQRITMVDKDGFIIADYHRDWVSRRLNFLELADSESSSKFDDAARVIRQMISGDGDTGTTRYSLKNMDGKNIDDIIAFNTIHSGEGWAIAVSTSIAESAYPTIRGMIGISGIIFLALGMLAAALASGVIAKPFELLKTATKAKTSFIANMSHDLRTPLTAVIGFSELSVINKELPQGLRDYQDLIYESGMKILGVVNDLLDISNIESGKFGVYSAEYDLPQFIVDTANSNLRHIGSSSIDLNIVTDGKLSAKVIGDALRSRQIFNNLLANAINNTRAGGTVEWRVSTEKTGDTVWLVSSVTDSSEGIKPEDIDKVFLDYSSLDTSKQRSSKGTGLGLALTKKIVDLMHGTLAVESTPGKGSVFTVRLPHKYVSDEFASAEFAEKLNKVKAAGQKRIDKAALQCIQLPEARVLVVDDVDINLMLAQGMLESYGITVDCVQSGEEAVELITSGEPRYDAIFLNRWVLGMDGVETVQIIRNHIGTEYAKNVPIIALVASAVGNNTFFLNAGFQDVLSKPIGILRMDSVVNKWIAPRKP
ncbi:MAG: ATP-binding protein [Treponema sp.]|nr:ATP-binding protein [Treponema sp.]